MRLSKDEREALLTAMQSKAAEMSAAELANTKASLSKAMAAGKCVSGDVQTDHAIYTIVMQALGERQREEAQRGLTPQQRFDAEASQLARRHHVSAIVATAYLKRRGRGAGAAPAIETPIDEAQQRRQDREQLHAKYMEQVQNRIANNGPDLP